MEKFCPSLSSNSIISISFCFSSVSLKDLVCLMNSLFQLEGICSPFAVSYHVADEPNTEQDVSLQGLAVSLLGLAYCLVHSKNFC